MALLALYWAIMIVGYIAGSRLRQKKEKFLFTEELTNIVIYILVLIMGLRMGSNEEVTSSLGTIGLQSLIITVMTVGGSMLFVFFARKYLKLDKEGMPIRDDRQEKKEEDGAGSGGGLRFTMFILAFVTAGMAAGYFALPQIYTHVLHRNLSDFQDMSGDWLVIGICVILGLAGFNLGISGNIFERFKGVGFKIVLVPIAAVGGSLIMGVIYSLMMSLLTDGGLSVKEAVAVSAGFGWYTFVPGILTEAGFAVAGAVSFMHNVIRETLGLVAIPVIAKKIGYLEATSVPGVSAMDVCLPLIERSCRPETVVYSFCTGALMCVTAPVAVTLCVG